MKIDPGSLALKDAIKALVFELIQAENETSKLQKRIEELTEINKALREKCNAKNTSNSDPNPSYSLPRRVGADG
jgi:hypothetical protein